MTYRILSKMNQKSEIKYYPQYKGYFGVWNYYISHFYDMRDNIGFDKLCEAYQFLDELIQNEKDQKEYGIKILEYPKNKDLQS